VFVHARIIQNWSFVLPFLKAWRMMGAFTSLFISSTPPFKMKYKFSALCRLLLFRFLSLFSFDPISFSPVLLFLKELFRSAAEGSKRFFP
jgi:hypothetical protein